MASDEAAVRRLYVDLLTAWNSADAAEFATAFLDDGEVIGFDGSTMNGRNEIEAELRAAAGSVSL